MPEEELRQARILIDAHRKFHSILKNMASWHSEIEIIEQLTQSIESLFPGRVGSVLLHDAAKGTLHHSGAQTRLDSNFVNRVDGTRIGPNNGSCGAAVFFKKPFIVADTETHPNWQQFKKEIRDAGFRSCWAMPILSKHDTVLGSFAIYAPEPVEPGEYELEILETAAHVASVALDKQELVKAACTDPLTGLNNRHHFQQTFQHLLSVAERNEQHVGLVFMDLNHFKQVNDQMGHDRGDGVLMLVADVLRSALRKTDISCRYGGDEFVFACIDISREHLNMLCLRILKGIQSIEDEEVLALGFGASFGAVIVAPKKSHDFKHLIKLADQEMYHAKASDLHLSIKVLS